MFGANRCLFGTNFPIEKLWTSYGAMIQVIRDCIGHLSFEEQSAILHDTAAEIYRI
jgi:predicted TIM-barrel fold metal-dependent hydrolase